MEIREKLCGIFLSAEKKVVQMKADGRSLKDIHEMLVETYRDGKVSAATLIVLYELAVQDKFKGIGNEKNIAKTDQFDAIEFLIDMNQMIAKMLNET